MEHRRCAHGRHFEHRLGHRPRRGGGHLEHDLRHRLEHRLRHRQRRLDTASGTVNTVSNTAGNTTATVGGVVGSLGSGAKPCPADQSSVTTGSASPLRFASAQQTAATELSPLRLPQGLQEDLVLLAQRSQAESVIGDQGHESCIALVGVACQATIEGDAPSSWTRSVADIIRKLLALTGGNVFLWILASCFLTLAGMISLFEARNRSELWSVRPS